MQLVGFIYILGYLTLTLFAPALVAGVIAVKISGRPELGIIVFVVMMFACMEIMPPPFGYD